MIVTACTKISVRDTARCAVVTMRRNGRSRSPKYARTEQVNALRGLLAEYGEVFGVGRKAFDAGMKAALERLAERLPVPLINILHGQWNEVARLDERMACIETSLEAWRRQGPAAKAIAEIPGVGLLTTTAAVATIGDAKAFRSGREFAAFIGLIPRGGKVKLLGISKRRDTYLRTLLVHGARSVIQYTKTPSP
jgi:transposase